jgi:hypothetical protein
MKRSFSGSAKGRGALYAWEGNKDVGQGSMEITEAQAPNRLALNLTFLKPFEAHNTTEFLFTPVAEGTEVTWTMNGPAPLISKVMQVFFNFDKMIGKDFEQGLANLKAQVEK